MCCTMGSQNMYSTSKIPLYCCGIFGHFQRNGWQFNALWKETHYTTARCLCTTSDPETAQSLHSHR